MSSSKKKSFFAIGHCVGSISLVINLLSRESKSQANVHSLMILNECRDVLRSVCFRDQDLKNKTSKEGKVSNGISNSQSRTKKS